LAWHSTRGWDADDLLDPKGNGQIICRSTVRPLLPEEWKYEAVQAARIEFDNAIRDKNGAFDPELLEVFDNTDIKHSSKTDDDEVDQSGPNKK
jgi:hypothetical protein